MPFEFQSTVLTDVVLVTAATFRDDRGWFSESYRAAAFSQAGIAEPFVQDNLSRSAKRGTLRGLHFQRPPAAQGKLVRCLEGAIFDVAVDLRQGSPTEGRAASFELDDTSGRMLWVPAGFAHGFQTLVDDCLVLYKTTAEYDPACEAGIRWDDAGLGIDWPVVDPILAPRDAAFPGLGAAFGIFP